jgi:hypothetical protein
MTVLLNSLFFIITSHLEVKNIIVLYCYLYDDSFCLTQSFEFICFGQPDRLRNEFKSQKFAIAIAKNVHSVFLDNWWVVQVKPICSIGDHMALYMHTNT